MRKVPLVDKPAVPEPEGEKKGMGLHAPVNGLSSDRHRDTKPIGIMTTEIGNQSLRALFMGREGYHDKVGSLR